MKLPSRKLKVMTQFHLELHNSPLIPHSTTKIYLKTRENPSQWLNSINFSSSNESYSDYCQQFLHHEKNIVILLKMWRNFCQNIHSALRVSLYTAFSCLFQALKWLYKYHHNMTLKLVEFIRSLVSRGVVQ